MMPKWVTSAAGWFYRLRYLGRGVPVLIDGQTFRFDESLRRWAFASELPMHRVLRAGLGSGSVYFDVGANFGQLAIPAAGWVAPGGQVHAFEPVPRHVALLERHKALNGSGAELRIIPAAVSNDPADDLAFEVPIEAVAVEAGIRVSGPGLVETLRVKNLRLDDYCRAARVAPDIIKIDVEGAELEVPRGAEQTLRETLPVLVIEVHDFALPIFGTDASEVARFLQQLGYGAPEVIQTGAGEKPWHQAVFTAARIPMARL
jgi:FkbM family methyltransferase